jgi:hypothetical protein
MIWPTEVNQCASSVIPEHALSPDHQQQLLIQMNQMFLNRDNPQHTVHGIARGWLIISAIYRTNGIYSLHHDHNIYLWANTSSLIFVCAC